MKNINISINLSTLIMAVLVLVGFWAMYVLHNLILLVLVAIVIASAMEPGVAFFVKHKIPRMISVLIMYVMVMGVIFGSVYLFIPPILDEAQSFFAILPEYLATAELPPSIQNAPIIGSELEKGTTNLVDYMLLLRESFVNTGQGILHFFTYIFGGLFSLLLTIILSFYFAIQETGVDDFLRVITPLKNQKYVLDLWRRSQRKIGLWMQGQLILSLIAGILVYLGLVILGVPYALLLAAFAAIMELIPVFGSIMSAVPAFLIAFSTGGVTLALIVLGMYLIVNQFQGNLIYPLVVKKIVGVPPILVIIALIAGAQLAGFMGIILSVPVAASLQELFSDLHKHRQAA